MLALLGTLINLALSACVLIIIVQVIVTWLIHFEIINKNNPQAQNLIGLLARVTDPVMKPVSKYVPPIAGIDLTPLVVIIIIQIVKYLVTVSMIVPNLP